MSREIKFRCWNVEDGFMHSLAFPTWNGSIEVWANNKPQTDTVFLSMHGPACEGVLEQYTGLKDKDGADIYEGDIISKMAYNGQEYQLDGVVVFDQGGFCLKCTKHRDPDSIGKMFAFSIYGNAVQLQKGSVIGNIHEQPHLLK